MCALLHGRGHPYILHAHRYVTRARQVRDLSEKWWLANTNDGIKAGYRRAFSGIQRAVLGKMALELKNKTCVNEVLNLKSELEGLGRRR